VLALSVAGYSGLASSTVDEDMSDTLHSDLLTPMRHCFCDLLATDARSVQYTDASNLGVPAIGVYNNITLYSCLDSLA
jgi:hypothetical protein